MRLVLSLILFLAGPSVCYAEEPLNQNPLQAKIVAHPLQLSPGAQGEVVISLALDPGYHAYLDKFKLAWIGPQEVKIGKLNISPVHEFADTFSGKAKEGIESSATVKAIIEIPVNMAEGAITATYSLTYQACTAKHCLFPKKINLTAELAVISNPAVATSAPGSFWQNLKKAVTGKASFKAVSEQGLLFSFLAIFVAGILTSLTPCVYPMIPITLAVIGAKSAQANRWRSFLLSVVYVLGIAITFSSLGVFAALSGSLFGSTISHPIVTFSLALIFVALGMSMYGVFEIQAPAFIRNHVGKQSNQRGYWGALFAGLVSGIVAGPCVGPVLIGVLAHVSEKRDVVYGFSLLFTYSMGMGLLFLLLGSFSGLVSRLPKAGPWMDVTKFVFGTTMIAMAFYYIQPSLPEKVFTVLALVALVLIALQFGAFRIQTRYGWIKLVLFAVAGGGLLSYLTHKQSPTVDPSVQTWRVYSESLLAEAKNQQQPVIIDFWAEWCVACKELEKLTFPQPEVQNHAKKFLLLKFDATEDSPQLAELKLRYNVLGLPTIIFIGRDGVVRTDLTLTGFEDAPSFAARMQKVLVP